MPEYRETEEAEVTDEEEKTEPPTSRKRERAIERGYVVKSIEINNFFILASLYLFFILIGSYITKLFFNFFKEFFYLIGNFQLNQENFLPFITRIILPRFIIILLPFFIFFPLVSLFSHFIQTGFAVQEDFIKFDLGKINPISNLRNIFSLNLVNRILISLLKFSVGLLLIFIAFKKIFWKASILPFIPVEKEVLVFKEWFKSFYLNFLLAFLFIAGIDYAFNKYRYEKSLMMTPKEIKEELKETEGDPLIKSRIRQMGRRILRKRMLENVKTADVVITNPTLISVALKYEEGKMNAPVVVAKGMGRLAEEIVRIAQINGVIIVENKILAQLLYRIVEVGDEIPVKLYKAVAEVLAYVYLLKNRI